MIVRLRGFSSTYKHRILELTYTFQGLYVVKFVACIANTDNFCGYDLANFKICSIKIYIFSKELVSNFERKKIGTFLFKARQFFAIIESVSKVLAQKEPTLTVWIPVSLQQINGQNWFQNIF